MTIRIPRFVLLFALLGLVLVGCSTGPSTHSISGTVTEAGTATSGGAGAPLQGVTVTLGSNTSSTSRTGAFEFNGVPAGDVSLSFTRDGYQPKTEDVSVTSDKQLAVELAPTGGRLTASGATLASLNSLDGSETDETKVAVSGNTSDLQGPDLSALNSVNTTLKSLTTAITVSELQALVNGRVVVIEYDSSGNFTQELPVDPGTNTIQLRVFDNAGNAYTTEPVHVFVTLDQLAMRVVLEWDRGGGTDVDLHLFKRNAGEANPMGGSDFMSGPWWTGDRHVDWRQKAPTDFGVGVQNPFLDIDDTLGFGPETIVLQEATPGQYHVWVHLFDLPGAVDKTTATVDVEFSRAGSGELVTRTFEKTLTKDWEYWYVTTVDWNSGTFIEVAPRN